MTGADPVATIRRMRAPNDDRPERDWAQAESFAVPDRAKGHWCVIHTGTADRGRNVRHMLAFRGAEGDGVGARPFFRRVRGGPDSLYRTVAYIPADADTYQLYLFSPDPAVVAAPLRFRPVGRALSALLLLWSRPAAAPRFAGLLLAGKFRRVRTMLTQLAGAVTTPSDYAEWIELFDTWPAEPPAAARSGPTVSALVFAREPGGPAALATMASLEAQGVPPATRVLSGPDADWRDAAAALPGDYLAVLGAGEVLPPHATWLAAFELERLGRPALCYADEDALDADGTRARPVFRPEPGPVMALSGTQSTGVWFVRRDVLPSVPLRRAPGWAEALRLELALRLHEAGETAVRRIPTVLSHRRPDTEAAPAALLAELANEHLERLDRPLRAAPSPSGLPLRLRHAGRAAPGVSILVPSTLRSPLVLRCILSVLERTAHRNLELVVGVSQPGPLDPVQREAAARITADGRARVLPIAAGSFNFSAVCNALARNTDKELVLLLNDDVSVEDGTWLDQMAAHLADPGVGIVGAKLLYPDRRVQHGGVMIGLAGLCDHVNRFLPGTAPGYADRAVVAQELSAVTAACLLVRRTAYDAVGGLDENYPSAFNDVDFCLRVGEAGHRVVFTPEAVLVHHEMLTYGSHYAGERAGFEGEEIRRMQRRWAPLVRNDPFHNPNLDLGTGREWQLAFPPRRPRTFQL